MRFERLDLAAFGRFTGRMLDFGGGTPDFHLLLGSNEAGKSTTLAAIADLLFGIEERTPYGFLHSYRDMLLAGTVAGADGARLVFQRRKGRVNTLLDEAGAPMDEARLAALRGSGDRAFFTGMFGLDHGRLRAGGENLLSAGGDLGQSLAQVSTAVGDLRALLGQMETLATQLFAPQAQKPRINAGLSRLKDLRASAAKALLKGEAWTQCRDEAARLEARLAEIGDERKALMGERSRLERIRRVRPLLARHGELERELAELAEVPLLPPEAGAERRAAFDQRIAGLRARQEAESQLERLTARRRGEVVDAGILAVAEAVAGLQRQHGAIAKALADLPSRRAERRQREAEIAEALRELGREPSPQGLSGQARALLPTGPARAAIRALIGEERERLADLRQTERAAEEAEALVSRLDGEITALPPPRDSGPLKDCLKEITRQGRPDDLLAEAEAGLERADAAVAAAVAALPGWSGDAAALARLPVPERPAITTAEERLGRAARRVEEAEKRRESCRSEEVRCQAELAGLTTSGPVATEAAVGDARRRRDDGWRLVRRRFVERIADGDPAEAAPIADSYERAVAEADALADRLKIEAKRAARLEEITARNARAEHECRAADEEWNRAVAALAAEEAAWADLWRASGLAVRQPRAMLDFLDARREGLALAEQASMLRQTVERLRRQVESGARRLAAVLEGVGEFGRDLDFAGLLARADATVQRLDHAANGRHALVARRANAEPDRIAACRRRDGAKAALADWRRRWEAALAPLGLGGETGTAAAEAILGLFERIAALVPQVEDLSRRIDAMDKDVDAFEREVRALIARAAPDLAGNPALDALSALAQRVQAAREAERAARELDSGIADAGDRKIAAERQVAAADETLLRLCRQAGCRLPEELEDAERRSARRRAAEEEKAARERDCLDNGDGLGLVELAVEAESLGRDEVAGAIDAVNGRLGMLDGEADRLRADLAQLQASLAAMNGDSAAAAAAEEAEQLAAELRDDCGRYIRLRLGRSLLNQAVERYRRRHQGPLMARAADLFRRLTLGAFAGLDTGFDDRDQPILLAVRNGGETLQISALSEGTRDQLFLALRLAAVDLHLAAGRRLPFVADDLLIHFDDDRAAAALAVLADLATRTQVLFFTHNRHMVEIARSRLPAGSYRVVEV